MQLEVLICCFKREQNGRPIHSCHRGPDSQALLSTLSHTLLTHSKNQEKGEITHQYANTNTKLGDALLRNVSLSSFVVFRGCFRHYQHCKLHFFTFYTNLWVTMSFASLKQAKQYCIRDYKIMKHISAPVSKSLSKVCESKIVS